MANRFFYFPGLPVGREVYIYRATDNFLVAADAALDPTGRFALPLAEDAGGYYAVTEGPVKPYKVLGTTDPSGSSVETVAAPGPLVINVAAAYGTTASAINQAMAAANALAVAFGGKTVTVQLDARTWDLESTITALDYVRVQGAGRGLTILRPTGGNPAVTAVRTNSTRLTGFELCDMTIDCVNQSGAYAYTKKGVYILYASATAIRRVTIKDAYATALGFDYPSDHCVVEDCVFINAGRGNPGTGGGGNGLGSLVGYAAAESMIVRDCDAIDCKQYGFLFETHNSNTIYAIGYRVTGCYATGCAVGFQDGGCSGLIFSACVAYNNDIGFALDSGDAQPGDSPPGRATLITGCTSARNRVGIVYDASLVAPKGAGTTITGCAIWSNTEAAVQVKLSSVGDINKLSIDNNKMFSNGPSSGSGFRAVSFISTGTSKCNDLSLFGNDMGDNYATAVYLDADINGGRISSNRIYDSGASRCATALYQVAGRTCTSVQFNGNDMQNVTNALATKVRMLGTLTGCLPTDCPGWTSGFGTPSAVVKAPLGTQFTRLDGVAGNSGGVYAPGTLLYINVDGGTGWRNFI